MGVKLGPLLREHGLGKQVDPSFFEGKKIAIDALPTIYEMLATIRDRKGGYLHDSRGRITSHLVGLFNRTSRMLAIGIKPIYVFDGPPHPLKLRELELRKERKEIALQKYVDALRRGDYVSAKKYAKQAMAVTDELVTSAKKLLELFGVPIVQAPHDGEAQAAYLVIKGEAYAVSSPDYDSFLYGAPRVVRNLKMSAKKEEIPTLYELQEVLKALGLSREQLVDLAILIGTDFNPEGFEGIGPKRALELIKKYGSLMEIIRLHKVKWKYDFSPEEVRRIFLEPSVSDNYDLTFRDPDFEGIIAYLVEEHDFSRDRVERELSEVRKRINREKRGGVQSSLDIFFGK